MLESDPSTPSFLVQIDFYTGKPTLEEEGGTATVDIGGAATTVEIPTEPLEEPPAAVDEQDQEFETQLEINTVVGDD
ncbi:hypothetical protein RJT34_16577 [Clitoria ternatea]|uniref:Uncharacterized protein n=1 Tax=Clitoria ternatea TaxID=43366 RepID=A0AAN9PDS6_CLITE